MMSFGIGIDLGGTRIKSARFDLSSGRKLATAMVDTRDGEWVDGLPAFASGIRELISQHEGEMGCAAATVGLAAPGLAARDGSCITWMRGKLEGLEGLVWCDFLRRPVKVLNDAHAALMGEVWQGAARGKEDVVMLTLGTGVGGAVLADGRLLQGRMGRAGHLGHMTVDVNAPADLARTPGSMEYLIGNGYLGARTGGRYKMTRDLLAAVAGGEPYAVEVWDGCLRALGAHVASLINAFDPELVVIGGGIANDFDKTLAPGLSRYLDEYEWRPREEDRVPVVHAELGEWAGCYGAVKFGL